MHEAIAKELRRFRTRYGIGQLRIAELGALNINGSVRSCLPPLTGFDIVAGKDVDVVIEPGVIPPEHVHQYHLVVASSSFHCCPKPDLYKTQILSLLKTDGLLWLSMCGPQCKRHHSTSANPYGFRDGLRMTRKTLVRFMEPEIKKLECYYGPNTHHQDMIYIGQKTC